MKKPRKHQPDKQPACPPLQVDGYSNEIKANPDVLSWWMYRSSTRLPVSGRAACVAYWMDSFGRCNGSIGWSVFGIRRS